MTRCTVEHLTFTR